MRSFVLGLILKLTYRHSSHLKIKMLLAYLDILSSKKIILASGSAQWKNILENLGLKFEISPSNFEENLDKSKYTP